MEKDEFKFLYIIVIIIALIAIALFLIVVNAQKKEVEKQKQNDAFLQEQLEMINKTKREDSVFKGATDVELKSAENNALIGKEYIGKWKRILMTINGSPENFSQATLEIGEDHFVKTTDCSISGSLSVDENKMMMSVENDGCKEGKNNFINNYSISPDGKLLTLSIDDPQFKMVEGYKKIDE
ncbi:MAG: hypothetical protein WCX74_03025 [Candidatus Paceibacterota bacterium]